MTPNPQASLRSTPAKPYTPPAGIPRRTVMERLDHITEGLVTEQGETERAPNRARTLIVLYQLEQEVRELKRQLVEAAEGGDEWVKLPL